MAKVRVVAASVVVLLAGAGFMATRAQDPVESPAPELTGSQASTQELPVSDPSCTFFGAEREKYLRSINRHTRGRLTAQVSAQLAPAYASTYSAAATAVSTIPSPPGGSRTDASQTASASGTIDKYVFEALAAAGVAPAPPTNDFEFIRRVYLDLTGRIPTTEAVIAFVNDADPDKRAKLVDSLIGSEAWVDKWVIWFSDLYKNNSRNTQIVRYLPGVMAYNSFLRTSLVNNKPYDQMAREMISAAGNDSYTQGELNYLVGGVMIGGPIQDVFDLQIANTAETFLGLSHLNCLLCHNGRGHLDSLSLWGYYQSRQQAWGMASFMSHTATISNPTANAVGGQPRYWSLLNNVRIGRANYTVDYQLNTQTGNRPPRGALNSTATVRPAYIFDDASPASGEDYRTFLAAKITSDFQFARATVNYIWEYFFGIGIVSPSNQFDPMRLDPDNPPVDCPPNTPCTLQPSNPRLLNGLAQDFVASGYNLRTLMRDIVNSRAYQLSSRYEGNWDPTMENLFARKLVRRLWSEEIHDAITQSSGIVPTYNNPTWGPVNWAMKFPEPFNTPAGPATGSPAGVAFLDAFLRGNRDDEERRPDGAISQALALMNDPFVVQQRVNSNAATSLIQKVLPMQNDQLVNTLFITVLSRYPTAAEMSAALENLKTNRTQEARNLLWSLYNKVDFIFNY
jgi:hypothetical protein